jgi:hypothetical protein
MKKLFKFLFLNERDKLIKVVSVRPNIALDGNGFSWPTMLIDGSMGRMTVSPIWGRKLLRDLFWRLRGWDQKKREGEAIARDWELVTVYNTTGYGPTSRQYWRPKS